MNKNRSIQEIAERLVTLCRKVKWEEAQKELYAQDAAREAEGVQTPWVSSRDGDFNFDFDVSLTEQQQRERTVEYNYRHEETWAKGGIGDTLTKRGEEPIGEIAAMTGTDVATDTREGPVMSAFVREDGVVYHTYPAYSRGLDVLRGMYQWLDRAPLGRNDGGIWLRRHDEYAV